METVRFTAFSVCKMELSHVGDRTPTRYGCSSWRHLLHESEQFEVRREQATPGEPTLTWYRSRSG
jgi:hypothetical protein